MTNKRYTYIPQRMKSVNKEDPYVTGAEDIDAGNGKSQQVKNTEVDETLTQLSNEIDAVNKQDIIPVDTLPAVATADSKKIYRVVGEDSYTDYMVNATSDGWKELATYSFPGIDDEPTAGSDNPVKSGGVQNELALGAVYDVSAKNPTAGPNNDGKWESLSALLSDANLNTLIPTAVRKGGMSVKFVQSSDNKYVQYFYRGTATTGNPNPFLNIDNWEKIILENELNSVEETANDAMFLTGAEDESINPQIAFEGEYYNYNTDVKVSDSTYNITKGFAVRKGDVVYVRCAAAPTVSVIFKGNTAGYYTQEGIKVEGKDGRNVLTYSIQCNFNGYICFSYVIAKGITVNVKRAAENILKDWVIELVNYGYTYRGVVKTTSNKPANPNNVNYFVIATENGTYTNFDNVVINNPSVICINNNQVYLVRELNVPFMNFTNVLIPVKIGLTSYRGKYISEATNRVTTGVLLSEGKMNVYVPKGYNLQYYYGEQYNDMTDSGAVITDGKGGFITVNVSTKYVAFNMTNINGDVETVDNFPFILASESSNDGRLLQELYLNKTNTDKMLEALIKRQFTDAVSITSTNITLCESSGCDINEDGIVAVGYMGAENTVGEHDSPINNGYLGIANLADLQSTKQNIRVFSVGESIQGFGEIVYVQDVAAKFLTNSTIRISADVGFYVSSTVRKSIRCSKTYDLSTDTLSSTVDSESISVLGTVYNMVTEYVNGWEQYAQSTINDIEAIWTATGIEHPTGYDGVNKYTYWLCGNPQKYNGYWWAALSLGNQSHALCKTVNLVDWEFVCDITLSQASEEVALCFYKNRLYVTSRGNYNVDSKYSKILYCPTNDLGNWSTPKTLSGCKNEGPSIAALNDKIYVYQGRGTASQSEGVDIKRGNKSLFVFDLNLNQLSRIDLSMCPTILHAHYIMYGGCIFVVVATDKRCFAFTKNGDGRSELSILRLENSLL